MNKEDILQALRLTAMGRTGHPLQEQLAEGLAALLATPEQRAEADMAGIDSLSDEDRKAVETMLAAEQRVRDAFAAAGMPVKRTRKAKAD